MTQPTRSPLAMIEWWLVMLLPALTILAGAAMIHVSVSFGFTAVGEPVAQAGPAVPANER